MAYSYRIRTQRNRLCQIAAVANTTRVDQRYLPRLANIVQCFARLPDGSDTGRETFLGKVVLPVYPVTIWF